MDALKLIAIVTMVVDHSKFIFPDCNLALSFIGRISFILFSFILAFNLNQIFQNGKFKSLQNYFKNLLLFALISELPYQLLFKESTQGTLNIMFSLLAGFLVICFFRLIDKNKFFIIPFFAVIFLSIILSNYLEYGFIGVLLILFFNLFFLLKNKLYKSILMLITLFLAIACNLQYYLDFIEIFGFLNADIFLIGFGSILGWCIGYLLYDFDLEKYNIPKIGKWAWWFYPAHMMVIWVLIVLL